MKTVNGIVLAALFVAASAGAAHAGLVTSDHRYFPNEASARASISSPLNALASMNLRAPSAPARAYHGGPKTGTGF